MSVKTAVEQRIVMLGSFYFRNRAKTHLRTAFPASGHRRQS